jgi:tetrahydromethanopterin S-methyltransferase subunit F
MAKTKDKVTDAADSVKPFVERALRDDKLRDDVQSAFATARKVYDELIGSRDVGKAASKVVGDKKLQRDLREAVEDLRDAAQRLQGRQRRSKSGGRRLLVAGIALGVLFNPVTGPETRRWLKELVAGGDDEFSGDFGSTNGGS